MSTESSMDVDSSSAALTEGLTPEASLSLGDSYLVDEEFGLAVECYTAVLSLEEPASVVIRLRTLSHRSAAWTAQQRHEEAREDAQAAFELLADGQSELREGEAETVHRRLARANMELKRYEPAKMVLTLASQLAYLNGRETSQYQEWIQECETKQSEAGKSVDAIAEAVKSTPAPSSSNMDTAVDAISEAVKSTPAPTTSNNTSVDAIMEAVKSTPAPTTSNSTVPASSSQRRPTVPKYQYYQSDTVMTIAILEPGVEPDKLHVTFAPRRLTVKLDKANTTLTIIHGNLFDAVDVDRCRIKYMEEKVLLKLRKREAHEWHELFGKAEDDKAPPADTTTVPVVPDSKPRAYASHRDWDAIERTLEQQEKQETPEGEEAMNKLFQQIYSNADEDTRRAMIKSYQTSGGTVLSTDWNEVAKKDYEKERTAPTGSEWKTWEGDKLSK